MKRKELQQELLTWYQEVKRPLPWRENKDVYRIWISEVMLQQTTVTAVIPYFTRFTKTFPTLKDLADAKEEKVLEQWSGLGYYSRARNLHKSAKALLADGFPQKADILIKYPGFGPYTSRAVTSIAFGEAVGVLDGNVIRVLSRLHNLETDWWKTKERNQLQELSDDLAQDTDSSEMNQALMELGATICTPTSPACLICPWQKKCVSLKAGTQHELPKSKPKKAKEIWIWKPEIVSNESGRKVALVKNDYAPFLKNQWLYPGKVQKKTTPPKTFSFKHNITHHEIYVQPQVSQKEFSAEDCAWSTPQKLHQWNPSALLKKTLEALKK